MVKLKLCRKIQFLACIAQTSSVLKNKRPTWCHLLFYFTSYVLNMFQTLMYPSSGACDYAVELPHLSYCSWFDVCWSFGVVWLEWYPCCMLKHNTHRTKNNTTNVVIQQNSRKLLMVDILMSETCWACKKWNKIASDIKLVFYSSTITTMHGPINIRFRCVVKEEKVCSCCTRNTTKFSWNTTNKMQHSTIYLFL